MSKVTLGEVAMEARESTKDPTGLPIVGLEHLVPGELRLSQYSDASENTFTKLFHKGQVLFGRRRAYQKKAAVADFDGVCSGDITVIAAKPDRLLPDLLPFIISDDRFFDFAMEKSAGSLSPRVKWAQLAEYAFDLPDDMEEQRRIASLLWAMERNRSAYKSLLTQMDELVKSQFVEMFGDPVKNTLSLPTMALSQATTDIISGQCLNGDAGALQPGQKAVLKVSAVTYGYFKADEYKVLRNTDQIVKGVYPHKGDLLFSRANTREYVGATALIEHDYPDLLLPDKLWKLVFIPEINPVFAKQFLSHPEVRKELSEMATGTSGSMYNISMEKLKTLVIIVPKMEQQRAFVQFVNQTDKSKYDSKVSLEGAWIGGDMCA